MTRRALLPPALLLSLIGCAGAPAPPEPQVAQCQVPRPQVCTMIYDPVCALHADGVRRTHASSCNACADDTVLGHRPGRCEEEEETP